VVVPQKLFRLTLPTKNRRFVRSQVLASYIFLWFEVRHKLWAEMWPRIMSNTIESCKRAGAKLVFFDTVYMYEKSAAR